MIDPIAENITSESNENINYDEKTIHRLHIYINIYIYTYIKYLFQN